MGQNLRWAIVIQRRNYLDDRSTMGAVDHRKRMVEVVLVLVMLVVLVMVVVMVMVMDRLLVQV